MKSCDLLLCEDTRRSKILLDRYDIKKKLDSYHSFNESQKNPFIIELLKKGTTIGLLTDGGCPAVCDPGFSLVDACIKENVPFTAIPGPAALIQALMLSGLPTVPFQFFGFVPKTGSEFLSLLPSVLCFPGTSIFYDSPQRLVDTLDAIAKIAPETEVVVARELTKTFEEVIRLKAVEAASYFKTVPPRGEIVLLLKGEETLFTDKEPEALVRELQEVYKISLPDAIKTASRLLKTPKQSIYKLFHHEK